MANIKTAKISSKGQITIPKSMRDTAEITEGDTVAIVSEGKTIMIINSDKLVKSFKSKRK